MTLHFDGSRLLGRGMYGMVWSGTLNSQPIAAKKCFNPSVVYREARLLKLCEHANVIQSYGVHSFDCEPYLIMELAEEGSLLDHCYGRTFSLRTKKHLVQQICRGLEHIHSQNIVHRDIQAQNLFLKNITEPYIVIGDFGEAQFYIEGKPRPNTHDVVMDAVYTFKSDVYLLARVVNQTFVEEGIMPMEEPSEALTGRARRQRTIRNASNTDPAARPTVAEFREAFRL